MSACFEISPCCRPGNATSSNGQNRLRNGLNALQSALRSGDTAAARKALTILQQETGKIQALKAAKTNLSPDGNAGEEASIRNIGESVDLDRAKLAIASFESDLLRAQAGFGQEAERDDLPSTHTEGVGTLVDITV